MNDVTFALPAARLRQGSAKSADVTILSAGVFLVLATLLSFMPDQPVGARSDWQLRGTLAPVPRERPVESARLNRCSGMPRDCANI